jgi:hypothetical protein
MPVGTATRTVVWTVTQTLNFGKASNSPRRQRFNQRLEANGVTWPVVHAGGTVVVSGSKSNGVRIRNVLKQIPQGPWAGPSAGSGQRSGQRSGNILSSAEQCIEGDS